MGEIGLELPGWTFDQTPRLRFVQTLGTGVDRFPFSRFPGSVQVAGNVGAFAPNVAEHAIALLLTLAHEVRANHELVRSGRLRPTAEWQRIQGSTIVLLGFGEIATGIADRLRPFGARIWGLGRSAHTAKSVEKWFPASALKEALSDADVIVDCRPLTLGTKRTIDERMLNAMKPTAIYVNIGRAGVVDEEALYRHLSTHPNFRVAMDVWWDEDSTDDTVRHRFPFMDLANFLGSPHGTEDDTDTWERALTLALTNLNRYFAGDPPMHVADRRDYVSA